MAKTKDEEIVINFLEHERDVLALQREILILRTEIKYYQGVLDGTISTEEPNRD